MNKINIQHAIDIMQRVINRDDKLDMSTWQGEEDDVIVDSENILHTCGTAACFAGWVAVSPEFQGDDGGVCKKTGAPLYAGDIGVYSIASWLDIPTNQSAKLCGIRLIERDSIPRDSITPEMVIQNLQRLLDGKHVVLYSEL